MCGRYVSARTEPDLIGGYGVEEVEPADQGRPGWVPCWNVAPTCAVPVVRALPNGRRTLASARWGLVPAWADDPSIGSRLINARVETVADKPAFRTALRSRRCLLPADGYYEWSRDPDGRRRPRLLSAAAGGGLTFAGLYETWRDPAAPDAAPLLTVTVLTRAATGPAASVHDRMPVLLPPSAWAAWLDPRLVDPDVALGLLDVAEPPPLEVTPANPAVGDVRQDGPHLLVAAPEDEPAPTLF